MWIRRITEVMVRNEALMEQLWAENQRYQEKLRERELHLQSVAEAVHLAIKLTEDALRAYDGLEVPYDEVYWARRMEALRDALKPAMMVLAPYLPSYVEPEKEFTEQAERGYLDGTDEQAY